MNCTRCGVPCRGRCPRCNRPKCMTCKPLCRCRSGVRSASNASYVQPYIPPPPAPPAAPPIKKLEDMTASEVSQHCYILEQRMKEQISTQQAYLSRRAARGTNTPTDTAYRRYVELNKEIVELLQKLRGGVEKEK